MKKIIIPFFVMFICFAHTLLIAQSPRDDIFDRSDLNSRKIPLTYNPIEERDVMWEKTVYREINVKELCNHHFAKEIDPLVNILLEATRQETISAYSSINDDFTKALTVEEFEKLIFTIDTVVLSYAPDFGLYLTDEVILMVTELNPNDVIRYRVKEVWYYDSHLSRMNVRILGIAPIVNRYDDRGNFLASMPLCWFYFDELRPILAKEPAFNLHNDNGQMSWDDVFLSRNFGSYITKESNTRDLRLQDIHSGGNILQESDRIHRKIFNFEQDLYFY